MKKTAYITPCTTETTMFPEQMIAYSGGGNGVTVTDKADYSDESNLSRSYNVWEKEEEEETGSFW